MAEPVRLPCVLFALERERLLLHETHRIEGKIDSVACPAFVCRNEQQRILVVESGVGFERTRQALDWLLSRPTVKGVSIDPPFLLFAGFAGALQPSLNIGDVILAREVVDVAGRVWSASGLAPALPGSRAGRILTSSRFIGDPTEKLALGKKHDALAVDMESAAFAQRCTERGVPWACLRVISDDASAAFTAEIAGLVEEGRVAYGRVFGLLARKPWVLPKLLRLGRQTRLAARRLADAVIQFLACSSAG